MRAKIGAADRPTDPKETSAMLDRLTADDFRRHLEQTVRVSAGDQAFDAELIEVSGLPTHDGDHRAPFSVTFRGPVEPWLEQQICAVEHAELGRLELFLVPLGPDGKGMRYEAVFT